MRSFEMQLEVTTTVGGPCGSVVGPAPVGALGAREKARQVVVLDVVERRDASQPELRDRHRDGVVDEVDAAWHVARRSDLAPRAAVAIASARVSVPSRGGTRHVVQLHRAALEAAVGAHHVAVGKHRHRLGPVAGGVLAEQAAHVGLRASDPAGEQRQERESEAHPPRGYCEPLWNTAAPWSCRRISDRHPVP